MSSKSKKQEKDNPKRGALLEAMSAFKRKLGNLQEELDADGEERKELTPDMVDALREGLMAIYTEADEEAHEAAMQLIVEAVSEAMPESDVDEERADDDGETEKQDDDEEEDEEKGEEAEKALNVITKEMAGMAKGYNDLIGDMGSVMEVVTGVVGLVKATAEERDDLKTQVKELTKIVKQRPRRASQAKETELDADSELGKAVEKQLFTAPAGYEDMFKNGES